MAFSFVPAVRFSASVFTTKDFFPAATVTTTSTSFVFAASLICATTSDEIVPVTFFLLSFPVVCTSAVTPETVPSSFFCVVIVTSVLLPSADTMVSFFTSVVWSFLGSEVDADEEPLLTLPVLFKITVPPSAAEGIVTVTFPPFTTYVFPEYRSVITEASPSVTGIVSCNSLVFTFIPTYNFVPWYSLAATSYLSLSEETTTFLVPLANTSVYAFRIDRSFL